MSKSFRDGIVTFLDGLWVNDWLDYVSLCRKLNKARAEFRRNDRFYKRHIAAAEAKGAGRDEIESLYSEAFHEYDIYKHEVDRLETVLLEWRARSLGLPVPDRNDDTQRMPSEWSSHRHLNVAAAAKLRGEIRKEVNERWQYWDMRFKLVTGLITGATGLVGALIGLVATGHLK